MMLTLELEAVYEYDIYLFTLEFLKTFCTWILTIQYFRGVRVSSAVFSSHCTLANTLVLRQFKNYLKDNHTEFSARHIHFKVLNITFYIKICHEGTLAFTLTEYSSFY